MRKFIITTDSGADLPNGFCRENHIGIIPFYYEINNELYDEKNNLPIKVFYEKMRKGEVPVTLASKPEMVRAKFEIYLEQGYDILHISFSSSLSGSFNNAYGAARELMEKHRDANIVVVDSLGASLGEGLLVYKAVEMKRSGEDIGKITNWLEKNKNKVCHKCIVDDLKYLYRGGKIPKSKMIIGAMANLKPVFTIDERGKIVKECCVSGRKKAINELVVSLKNAVAENENAKEIVFISHSDAYEDAVLLEK